MTVKTFSCSQWTTAMARIALKNSA